MRTVDVTRFVQQRTMAKGVERKEKNQSKPGKKSTSSAGTDVSDIIEGPVDLKALQAEIDSSIQAFRDELQMIRLGRASANMVLHFPYQ